MAQSFDGASNKLVAAKTAISETVNLMDGWGNDSRFGLISYYGGTSGSGTPTTYSVHTNNTIAVRPFAGGLTDNTTTIKNKLDGINNPIGSTPTYHGLDFAISEMGIDNNSGQIPVIILLSDGVPTLSSERYSYSDSDVNAVHPISDTLGWFENPIDVRVQGATYSGNTINGLSSYAGEPVYDVMNLISTTRATTSTYLFHSVSIQGTGSAFFNDEMMRYVAHEGGGRYKAELSQTALNEAVEDAVLDTACALGGMKVNEFLDHAASDWNGDGTADSGDNYVELFNRSVTNTWNVSNYTIVQGSQVYTLTGTFIPGETKTYFYQEMGFSQSSGASTVRLRQSGFTIDQMTSVGDSSGTYEDQVKSLSRENERVYADWVASPHMSNEPVDLWVERFMPSPFNSDWNNDGSANQNDEYVVITNRTSQSKNLTLYQLDDGAGGSSPYQLTGTLGAWQSTTIYRSDSSLDLGSTDWVRLRPKGQHYNFDRKGYSSANNNDEYQHTLSNGWTVNQVVKGGTPTPIP